MDQHTMVEEAYKNGYAKGFEAGKKTAVVHGWWDKYEDDKFIGYDANGRIQYRKVYTYYCGRCGRGTAVKTNYCPKCGAMMRKEVQDE